MRFHKRAFGVLYVIVFIGPGFLLDMAALLGQRLDRMNEAMRHWVNTED